MPHTPRKRLLNDKRREVVARFIAGETAQQLANEFGVSVTTIDLWRRKAGVYKNKVGEKNSPYTEDEKLTLDGGRTEVICHNEEMSYKENLRWAIETAGNFLRTKKPPIECPNNSAWYLYIQAVKEPKDFLAKLGQIEVKEKEDQGVTDLAKECVKNEDEITKFLEELKNSEFIKYSIKD